MATNVSRRFAETTEEEIQTKRLKLNADNTLKSNKKSANILREYIKEKNQDSLFENYVTVRLNETLAHFTRTWENQMEEGTSLPRLNLFATA